MMSINDPGVGRPQTLEGQTDAVRAWQHDVIARVTGLHFWAGFDMPVVVVIYCARR